VVGEGRTRPAVIILCRAVQRFSVLGLLPYEVYACRYSAAAEENWPGQQWREELQTSVELAVPLQTSGEGGTVSTVGVSCQQWYDAFDAVRLPSVPQHRDCSN